VSSAEATKRRILTATLELLQEQPGAPISMGDVAQRAGLSRQALYLHFADRTALLVEASRQADADNRTPARQRRVDAALTARDALREAVRLQAYLKPRLHGMTTALAVLRRTDPAAESAWQERDQARLGRCRQLARRLHDDGELRCDYTIEQAAALLWCLMSPAVWEDLVLNLGWSNSQYVGHVVSVLEHGLFTDHVGNEAPLRA
jgi:AcrR family transcriptional regulator